LLTKEPRHVVLVRLAPHGLGLWFYAGHGVEHGDGAVEHTQRTFDLDGEVDVARRVDDVDLTIAPLGRRRGGRDRDAALLFLHHVVHDRGALVDLTDLVRAAGVVEDAFGRGRLARVDVGHDPDVAGLLERECTCHRSAPNTFCFARLRSRRQKRVVYVGVDCDPGPTPGPAHQR